MKELEYIDPQFDISNLPTFNNIDGLKDISEYLDFAISSTIHKQIPNVTEENEKRLAAVILKGYMNGDKTAFTSKYNIRDNINKIGPEKIKNLLLKTLIEKREQNFRILHKPKPESFEDECANYVTEIAYYGKLEENEDWIKKYISSFIDVYIEEKYKKPYEVKQQQELICYENRTTTKALEQLNLQMKLNGIKY